MNSTAPSPQDPGTPDHSSTPAFGGAPYGTPAHGAPGAPPLAPVKKGRKKGLIAAGCGCLVLLVLLIAGCSVLALSGGDDETGAQSAAETEVPVDDAAEPAAEDAPAEDVAADDDPAEDAPPEEAPAEEAPAEEAPAEDDVPAEYTSALNSAETYSDLMHMSSQGIVDQLTSDYGDQFSPEAAQYAVDTLEVDWNDNALQNGQNYADTLHMSKQGVYDQLSSEFGEQFTAEQAQYAIDNIEADWNDNALQSARSYRDTLDMSPEAIRDQLSSEYGDQFTQEQADYAIEHLDD